MNLRVCRWLSKCFPSQWRAEYGEEFKELLKRRSLTPADVTDVLRSACKEWARTPIFRLFAVLITSALVFGKPIWRALSDPAILVLREHGFRPPALVSNMPYEALGVVWLGIPLVLTIVSIYPLSLAYKEAILSHHRKEPFAFWSAITLVISLFVGFTLWRKGYPVEMLVQHRLASSANPLISIGDFFALFAASTFLWVFAWQTLILVIFKWRRRTHLTD